MQTHDGERNKFYSRNLFCGVKWLGESHILFFYRISGLFPDFQSTFHIRDILIAQVLHCFGGQRPPFINNSIDNYFGIFIRDQLMNVKGKLTQRHIDSTG